RRLARLIRLIRLLPATLRLAGALVPAGLLVAARLVRVLTRLVPARVALALLALLRPGIRPLDASARRLRLLSGLRLFALRLLRLTGELAGDLRKLLLRLAARLSRAGALAFGLLLPGSGALAPLALAFGLLALLLLLLVTLRATTSGGTGAGRLFLLALFGFDLAQRFVHFDALLLVGLLRITK